MRSDVFLFFISALGWVPAFAADPPVPNDVASIAGSGFTFSGAVATGVASCSANVPANKNFCRFQPLYGNFYAMSATTDVSTLNSPAACFFRKPGADGTPTSAESGKPSVLTPPDRPTLNPPTPEGYKTFGFRISWLSVPEATGYLLDVSAVQNFSSFVAGYNNKDLGAVTSFDLVGLSPYTKYYYRVRAYNGGEISANSDTQYGFTKLSAPTANSLPERTSQSITATWNPVPGAIGYQVSFSENSNLSFHTLYETNNTSLVISEASPSTPLRPHTAYYYAVQAKVALPAYTSDLSNTVSTSTRYSPPQVVISNQTAVGFTVSWTPLCSAGLSGCTVNYFLDVSANSNFANFVSGFNNNPTGNRSSVVLTSLESNTTYYVRARAGDSANDPHISLHSATVSVTLKPSVPETQEALNPTSSSFTARWKLINNAYYLLDVATDRGFGAASILPNYNNKRIDAGANSAVVSGLSPTAEYYYRVSASNGTDTSDKSPAVTVRTSAEAPVANAGIHITAFSFTASWSPVNNADSYEIDVSTNADFTSFYGVYNRYSETAVSLSVTGLTVNTPFYYRVRAVAAGYPNSPNSNIVTAATLQTGTGTMEAANITATSFTAKWYPAAGASLYYLDVARNNDFSSPLDNYNNKQVSGTSCEVTGLSANTDYYYRVRSVLNGQASDNSNSVSVKTRLSSPAVSVGGRGSDKFTLTWTAVGGAARYNIRVAASETLSPPLAFSGDVVAGTSKDIVALAANTQYFYRVEASGYTNSSAAPVASVYTRLPKPVSVSVANIRTTSFTANWEAVPGAAYYQVEAASDQSFSQLVPGNRSVSTTHCTVSNLTENTQYYFRVKAFNNHTDSENSDSFPLYTAAAGPVLNNASNNDNNEVILSWSPVAGSSGYSVEAAFDPDFVNKVAKYDGTAASSRASGNRFPILDLVKFQTYYFRVRSYTTILSTVTYSEYSNVIAVTVGFSVRAYDATAVSYFGFTAGWSSLSNATYLADVSTDPAFSNLLPGYSNKPVNASPLTVTELAPSTTYYYRVRAVSGSNTSAYSNSVAVTTLPQALDATNRSVVGFTANWATVNGSSGYFLDVAKDSNFSNLLPDCNNLRVNSTAKDVVGLQPYTNYYYRVRTQAGTLTSANSNTVQVRTLLGVPVANAGGNVLKSSFAASWSPVAGAADYIIDVSSNNFAAYEDGYHDKSVNAASCNVTLTTSKASYQYRVRARNGSDVSDYSNTVTVLTDVTAIEDEAQPLVEAYPNPTAKSVTFSFFSNNENLLLTIFDSTGKKVTELINTYFAKGKHETRWEASEHNQGLYFWKLIHANGTIEAGKIVVAQQDDGQ